MSTGMRIAKFAGIIFLCVSPCLGSLSFATDQKTDPKTEQKIQKKTKKTAQLAPLPNGPTGPVPQIPLDSMAPVLPQVNFENGQLTIVAPNSTLGDILRAVRKQTGADIDVPEAKERVVTHLGPGPARDVIAELLNGSRFNYVLLGSPDDASILTRVVLVQKSGPEIAAAQGLGQPGQRRPGEAVQPQPDEAMADSNDADTPEENADENTEQQPAAEAEQPVANPDQPGVRTPQQLLQEMQQRQLQIQQQQQQGQAGQPGQPPAPGAGPVQQQPPQQPQQQ